MAYDQLDDVTINTQFSPRIAVPDCEEWLARDAKLSADTRAALRHTADIAYGESPGERLDVFPATDPGAPIHVYIHGGYWRALDKSDFSYVARPLVAAGATTVLLNYDLCPKVTLDIIVQQIRNAVIWVYRHAGLLGGSADRIYLSGSSAGAHLAAMMLAQDWSRSPVPDDVIKGAVCITGIYDVEPVLRIQANEQIRLKPEMVARNSPLRFAPRRRCPALVAVGAKETPEWIKQSEAYEAHLKRHGLPTSLLKLPDTHHFSITQSLSWPDSVLARAMLQQMGL
ncbi:esterase [Hypericibacter adhaerens]|jgi:arylformamidase|uniref:Esterase n=1 Tax=Hypericibacter adhaerens TaxID=2602016 RepID=A0A5J6N135_9PROT|nr:alpha/beta hydrolase [Hypericibacter adhaerens]QEX22665.1 esterase [Hypericibacter adhaerens]